ncbi:MAG: TRAP transporter substrate-binding protein [Dehalococcoidia bacterium]
MRKLSILLVGVVVIALLSGLAISCVSEEPGETEKSPEPVVLKFASAATAEYQNPEKGFAEAFNERCGPDYKIEYYGAGSMLSFGELLDGVRTGAADIGAITPSSASADDARLGATEMPFLFNNIDAAIYATKDLKPLFNGILEEKFNQKLMCLHNYTSVEILSTKPVKTLEDWDGLLVQAVSPSTSALVESLGGAAVSSIPYTEAYSALEKGTVDASINAPAAMRLFKLYEIAEYLTTSYMNAAFHGFSINQDTWNKLPEDVQDIMMEEAQKASDDIDEWLIGEWDSDFEKLSDLGVEVYHVPQSELERWREACQPYIDNQMEKLGDSGEKVVEIAETANAEYPRE